MKTYNTISTEKQQKCQHWHLEKLTNMNLTGDEVLPSDQNILIEQAKFIYCPSGKALEKQIKQLRTKEQSK